MLYRKTGDDIRKIEATWTLSEAIQPEDDDSNLEDTGVSKRAGK